MAEPDSKSKSKGKIKFIWMASRVTRTMWECFIRGTLRRGPISLCEKIKIKNR
jgi:hypothetical protein